ncbi:MAG TPA: DUF2231 domain-containing protein [Bryobacteraceae bacterium]|nr:DUF2231 domain-containing protein [Bryobacteraceae bacterium]
MFKSTLAGHPLHPMLIVAPAGLLPFSFVMDLMHLATKEQSYADAAYHSLVGGFWSGIAAGAAGAVDYMSIPDQSPIKRTGTTHAVLNIAMLSMQAVSLSMRRGRSRPPAAAVALAGVSTAGLLVSAWFGGHMVYEQGLRVKGRDEIEKVPDLKLPGDERIAESLERLQL